ncbi:MAG: RRXRR domain-containing protein [Agathobacter sp.]|nr:RRXRR domain-containing protein [Agathobacter sp.]
MTNIYVLNKDGTPLMPLHSFRRARNMIKSEKAVVANRNPFTIRLTEQMDDPVVDKCVLGIDPGRTNIGLCVIDSKGNPLYSAVLTTRNKDIKKLMSNRKNYRQARRGGARKKRKRRDIAADKIGNAKDTEYWRMLPGYSKPVCCKVCRNKEAKFNHRKRPTGWLTPTARHLLQTHINVVDKVSKILPISEVAIEINRFDFARLENPNIRNWDYQRGKLFGFNNVREAVAYQQHGQCLLCGKKKIQQYHHIVPRSKGGSESLDNYAGLCTKCHDRVHKDTDAKNALLSKKQGVMMKYHALSVLNQIMQSLIDELAGKYPVYVTTGRETHMIRESMGLADKYPDDGTHYIDAWCIAVSAHWSYQQDEPPQFEHVYELKQYRRHNRAQIHSQRQRTYYLDGKVVAQNRNKRTGQADGDKYDSLAEFREIHPELVDRLVAKKSTRHYNDLNRILPGAVYNYAGKLYVLRGSGNKGKKFYSVRSGTTYHYYKKCKVLYHNSGIVCIPRT